MHSHWYEDEMDWRVFLDCETFAEILSRVARGVG